MVWGPFSINSIAGPYFYEVSHGRVPGVTAGFVVGQNNNTSSDRFDSVTDQGGKYTYLTENTQLFVSSSDASDDNVSILMVGLDDDYNPVTIAGNTDGQSQSALTLGTSFRVHSFFVAGGISPVGELYLAEAGALTNGVPDDATKIKAKIPLSTDILGNMVDGGNEFASDNFSHLGLVTVPEGKNLSIVRIIGGTGKDDNMKLGGRIRAPGGVWFNRNPVPVYQSNVVVEFSPNVVIAEKSDFEFLAICGSPSSLSQVQMFFTLEDM